MFPEGKARHLSKETIEKIDKIPESETNPYKKLHANQLAEYGIGEKIDDMPPELAQQLNDRDSIMPENNAFEDVDMKDEQDRKVLVAIKK